MVINSKLPNVGTTIFTVMSALADQHKAINLSQGFPNFDTPQELKKLVSAYMEKGFNQYPPMAGVLQLRGVLADKIKKLYNLEVDPNTEITITAGGTQGIFTAIGAFIKPHDEVILIEPAYDSYAPSVAVFGGKVVPIRLSPPDFTIDWNYFKSKINDKTRMIVINNPTNPTGKTLKGNDLRILEKITKGSDIIILSDEVYEHLVYDKQQHQSVLRYPNLFKRSIAVYSFGKTFHATGWKVGYVVAPEDLMREFRKVHQFNVFTVNTPVQYALADFLNDENQYLSLPDFYQNKRDYFLKLMRDSRFKPLKSEGTYFQLFDYQDISRENDIDFSKRMTIEYGVAAIPITVFYTSTEGYNAHIIRLCFAKTEETLVKAAERLSQI
jgi:methionine transaminase